MPTPTFLRRPPSQCSWLTANTLDTMHPSEGLPSRHVHAWRQASELYRDAQIAISAEAFLELSWTIEQTLESNMCLINAAILFAQLGEPHIATDILDGAEPPEELAALVMFILGHVEAQQSHHARAQLCFNICVNKLSVESERKLDFRHCGLDFALSVADCRYYLFIIRTMKDSLSDELESLANFPLDTLFKPPKLPDDEYNAPLSPVSDVSSRSSIGSGVPTLTDQSIPSSLENAPTPTSTEARDSGLWCMPAPLHNVKQQQRAISPLRYGLFPRTGGVGEDPVPVSHLLDEEVDGLRRITLTDGNASQCTFDTTDEWLHTIIEDSAFDGPPILPLKNPRRNTAGSRELQTPGIPSSPNTAVDPIPVPAVPVSGLSHPVEKLVVSSPPKPAPERRKSKFRLDKMSNKREKKDVAPLPLLIRPSLPRTPSVMSKMSWKSTFSRRPPGEERTGYASQYQRRLEAQQVNSFAVFFGGFGRM
ncbi:uncharacterized protein MYCFIDRAFT_214410 [Pseudocercospora fijiensis CIRAD86]|uniref:Uncharacterized protein n=1 Tax=Pseudocercospora fijiensis (strain CIRAD86) TaxID=383855 RepID=M3BCI1_PSEFD|nr:uncharacterized protein MYCFIDRAFT_214410 [Pseudocercospora fijiensis CIRAD86]EME86873.1 hypothetical protein MYCFIDRAFT_214410 [Pseudocercospora fijiensis CIRAD86]